MPTDIQEIFLKQVNEETNDVCIKLANAASAEEFAEKLYGISGEIEKIIKGQFVEYLKNTKNGDDLLLLRSEAAKNSLALVIKDLDKTNIDLLIKMTSSDNNSLYETLSNESKFKSLKGLLFLKDKNFPDSVLNSVRQLAKDKSESLIKEEYAKLESVFRKNDKIFYTLPTQADVKTDADLEKRIRDKLTDLGSDQVKNLPKNKVDELVQHIKAESLVSFKNELTAQATKTTSSAPISAVVKGAEEILQTRKVALQNHELDANYIEAKKRKQRTFTSSWAGLPGPEVAHKNALKEFDNLKTLQAFSQRDLNLLERQKVSLDFQENIAKCSHSKLIDTSKTFNFEELKKEQDTLDRVEEVTRNAKIEIAARLVLNRMINKAVETPPTTPTPPTPPTTLTEDQKKDFIDNALEEIKSLDIDAPQAIFDAVLTAKSAVILAALGKTSSSENRIESRAAAESNDRLPENHVALINARIAAVSVANEDEDTIKSAAKLAAEKAGLVSLKSDPIAAEAFRATATARTAATASGNTKNYANHYTKATQVTVSVLAHSKSNTKYIKDEDSNSKTYILPGVVNLAAEAERVTGMVRGLPIKNTPDDLNTKIAGGGITLEHVSLKGAQDYQVTTKPLNSGVLFLAQDIQGTIHGISQIDNITAGLSPEDRNKIIKDQIDEALLHAELRLLNYKDGDVITIFTTGQQDPERAMRLHAALLYLAQGLGIDQTIQIKQKVGHCYTPEARYLRGGYDNDTFIKAHLTRDLGSIKEQRQSFKNKMDTIKENRSTLSKPSDGKTKDDENKDGDQLPFKP